MVMFHRKRQSKLRSTGKGKVFKSVEDICSMYKDKNFKYL